MDGTSGCVELDQSLQRFKEYPLNLIEADQSLDILKEYCERLEARKDKIFRDEESGPSILCWELADNENEFKSHRVKSLNDVKQRLGIEQQLHKDPQCRFVFIQAPNARDQLYITKNMLLYLLSYHQVTARFLEYFFSFGENYAEQDPYFSNLYYEYRLATVKPDCYNPRKNLGRSGRATQLCFNLKGVEPTVGGWPWSIRQAAIYHSFDIVNGRAVWIILKANDKLRRRIIDPENAENKMAAELKKVVRSFRAALSTMISLCSWPGENWRSYINFLEVMLQKSSEGTLMASVDDMEGPMFDNLQRRATTGLSQSQPTHIPDNPGRVTLIKRATAGLKEGWKSQNVEQHELKLNQTNLAESLARLKEFSFNDLPRLQFINDKANEALRVLKADVSILNQLRQYYTLFFEEEDFPENLAKECGRDMRRFHRRIRGIIEDLEMHISSLETLLQVLSGRKALLLAILDYRNSAINLEASQNSADHATIMTDLTKQMHKIAKKTEIEAVSVRVITLVTLCYLPGTYISALMSTDIVRFSQDGSREIYSWPALRLYLIITLPLTFVTLVFWWVFYKWDVIFRDAFRRFWSAFRGNKSTD